MIVHKSNVLEWLAFVYEEYSPIRCPLSQSVPMQTHLGVYQQVDVENCHGHHLQSLCYS